jgi:hypothetical protein
LPREFQITFLDIFGTVNLSRGFLLCANKFEVLASKEEVMTDPRFTDPPPDPMLRRDDSLSDTWGWIAGLAVLALIAFVLIAGWNSSSNTASNGTSPMTTGSSAPPPMRLSPPTTTGSGTTAPTMSPIAPSPPPADAGQK